MPDRNPTLLNIESGSAGDVLSIMKLVVLRRLKSNVGFLSGIFSPDRDDF